MGDVDDTEAGDRQAALGEFGDDSGAGIDAAALSDRIDANAETINELTDVLEQVTDQLTDLTDLAAGSDVGVRSDPDDADVPFYQ